MKRFYWFTKSSFKVFFKMFYRHKVYGLEHFFKGRGIIAPNHTSFFDPPIIAASWPEEISFLARKTLFSSRIFGHMLSNLNAYPVDGTTQDLGSIKLVCRLLADNKKVVIFPEGIRSRTGELGSIKSGIGMLALRCQAPIIPVYISGSYNIWNRYQKIPKFSGNMACVFGSPVDWQRFEHLGKKEAQEAISISVKHAIEQLKIWYENGAIGSPP
jgi:1-acyl-sn-glycerol-3-phosphate acyltransferase